MDHHNHNQHLTNDSSSSSSFCKPMMSSGHGGMIMYMDGFTFSLFHHNNSSSSSSLSPCLNLLFSGYTLDNPYKFILAMIIVTCIGISVEGIAWLKRRYVIGIKKKIRTNNNNDNIHTSTAAAATTINDNTNNNNNIVDDKEYIIAKYVLAGLQGLQAFIGYILMLAVMTYSIELLLSAILGLSLGFIIFGKYKFLLRDNEDIIMTEVSGDGGGGHGESSTTPCCDFMDDIIIDDDIIDSTNHHHHHYHHHHGYTSVLNDDIDSTSSSSLFLRKTTVSKDLVD